MTSSEKVEAMQSDQTEVTITLTPRTAEALRFIYHAYYFGLFKSIRRHKEEEYELRDALKELNDAIEKAEIYKKGLNAK